MTIWTALATTALEYAAAWMDANCIDLPPDIAADLAALKFKPGQSIESIQDEYNTRLYSALDDYTQSGASVTRFKNAYRRTISDGMNFAALAGWADSGGQGGMPDKLQTWVNGQIDREIGFADDVWQQIRELRKTGTADEIASWIQQRADGYTNALTGVYAYAETFANPDQMGRWVFGDTIEHCEEDSGKGTIGCSQLEGQVHPLSWWRENGYIPQQRGNDKITCGGWQCQCRIVDPETGETLIPGQI